MLLSSLLFIPLLGILLICAGRSTLPLKGLIPLLGGSHERSNLRIQPSGTGDQVFALSNLLIDENKALDFAYSSRVGVSSDFKILKLIALGTSILNLIISLIIYISFDFSSNQFQFVSPLGETSLCSLDIGVDSLSLYFVLLTTFIAPIALLSN